MKDWRNEPITQKQKDYILEIQEMSDFYLPEFYGKTKGEASDYINTYKQYIYESSWAIEHGYNN